MKLKRGCGPEFRVPTCSSLCILNDLVYPAPVPLILFFINSVPHFLAPNQCQTAIQTLFTQTRTGLILKSYSKWCHVIRRGRELGSAVTFLPASADLRRAPPSSPHLLPRKRQRGRVTRSGLRLPSPRPRAAPPLPDPDWLSAFICIFLPLFPAGGQSARGARRWCWAGLGLQLQLPQVPERAGAAAGAARIAVQAPDPPPVSALLSRLGQAPKARTKKAVWEGPLEPHLPAVVGNYRLQDGLRGLCVFQKLPLRAQPALHREYPEPVPARPGALHLLRCCLASLPGQRPSHFIPRPLRVFPRCARPGPRHLSPLATWSRRLSQSLPFLHCEAAVFLARWPRLGHIALPRPLTHRLVFQLFDQTIPLFSSATPKPIWDGFGGGRAASGLKTVLQNNVVI